MDAEAAGLQIHLVQAAPIPLAVELHCAPGEVLALVGPSGSGKSTVLRCIAGLYRARAGRVELDGRCWFDAARGVCLTPQARAVGLVFQNYALFPHLSALANVMAALGHRPAAERAARARALLERVHLAGFEARLPAALSGGQQQRVAVARALAREPQVLLLDEPFSAVDQLTRQKLYRELAQLRREWRMPVLLVTHDLHEAAQLADRLCILHRGRTLQTSPPAEALSRPCSALVARLVGLRNLFEGRVVAQRADAGLTLLDWDGRRLEARHAPDHAVGSRVTWVVPPADVILHRRDRPSRGERENPVPGTVTECVTLGEHTSVVLRVAGGLPLSLTVPTHVARRNGIAVGAPATVSLRAEGIHLMPWQDLRRGDGP